MGTLCPFGISVVFSPLVLQSFVAHYNGPLIGDTVWNNAFQYSTPRIGGLVGTAVYGLGEVIGSPGFSNLRLHANYVNGPFSAALSYAVAVEKSKDDPNVTVKLILLLAASRKLAVRV